MSQSSGPPPAAIQRVPVFQTMREAYRAVFTSLPLLFKAAALPFLLSLAILGLSFMTGDSAFLSFVLTVVGFVPYTLFGVAWHRLTLLGPSQGAPVAFPAWHRRHWRFLGYVATMTGLFYLLVLPFIAFGYGNLTAEGAAMVGTTMVFLALAVLAAIVTLPYVLLRFSFVFPAAAVDEDYGLANAWAHTRGQGFRLLATLFVTALPMLIVIGITSSLLGSLVLSDVAATAQGADMSPEDAFRQVIADNAGPFILVQLVLAALNYIVMALMVSAISIAFIFCTGWVPAIPAGPPMVRNGDDDDNGANP